MDINNKNIFQVSIGLDHKHKEVQNSISLMLNKNPEWTYNLIVDKKDMDNFMFDYFSESNPDWYDTYCEIPNVIESHGSGIKTDIRRLVAQIDMYKVCVLYIYGGLYLDIDSELFGNFDHFLQCGAFFLVDDNQVFNCMFYSEKQHPVLSLILDAMSKQILIIKQSNLMLSTGPHLHTNVALSMLDADKKKLEYISSIAQIDNKPITYNYIDKKRDYEFLTTNNIKFSASAEFKKFLYNDENDLNSHFNPHWHI